MTLTVSVKWQKEIFTDIEIDTSQPPIEFKGQLYALTGVPPERQKIMVKGGLLQDEGEWAKAGIKQGQRLMMMGTADAIPVAPVNAPVFVEDLPEEDQDDAIHRGSKSAGLVNLGNTCYMNSTVQCLHAVPELKTALSLYKATDGVGQDQSHSLALATRDLFTELGTSMRAVTPMRFLQVLRQKFPQFAQRGEQGMFMQQDAEECWTQLVSTLFLRLRSNINPSQSVVKELFGIGIKSTTKSEESGESSTEEETAFTLKCHITVEVNHLNQGLEAGLKDSLEKNSPALGRTALFTKISQIGSLPPYLTVQFVRFFWKRESQQKAKILRKVGFPFVLDVYEFCSPELQKQLEGPRKRHKELQDQKAHESSEKEKSAAAGTAKNGASTSDSAAESKEKVEEKKEEATGMETETTAEGATSAPEGGDVEMKPAEGGKEEGTSTGTSAGAAAPEADRGAQTGMFDLVAVLTHKGRSADSGHYVAWVKQENGKWVEFDDDNPIPRRDEDILKLSGGGDWHMAYILLYKARLV